MSKKEAQKSIGKDALKFLSMLFTSLLDGRIDSKEGAVLIERGADLLYRIADEFALERVLDEELFKQMKKREPEPTPDERAAEE